MPTDSDSNRPGRGRLAQVVAAVAVNMLAFGVVAAVLALVFPPMVSPQRLLAHSVALLAVVVGMIVANVWVGSRAAQHVDAGSKDDGLGNGRAVIRPGVAKLPLAIVVTGG